MTAFPAFQHLVLMTVDLSEMMKSPLEINPDIRSP